MTTVKADKTKVMVIINKEKLSTKVNSFVKENHMEQLNKDPTEIYQKQIHQAIHKCNILIDKQAHKYLLNVKPMAPQLNVYIETHKEDQPIRPIMNNTQAPSYKVAKHMNKKLQSLLCLPYTCNTRNSQEIAEELIKLPVNERMRIITLDIKDMYVNLPITGIMQTTKFWLNKHNNNKKRIDRTNTTYARYYIETKLFQYNDQIFQPKKGIAMGSPISSTIAGVYLQYIEETYMKQWLDSKEIIYYKRYVDDILIIYDQSKTNEQIILYKMNNIDKNLQFRLSTEENNTNYLHTFIQRNNKSLDIGIYRKPTETGSHSLDH